MTGWKCGWYKHADGNPIQVLAVDCEGSAIALFGDDEARGLWFAHIYARDDSKKFEFVGEEKPRPKVKVKREAQGMVVGEDPDHGWVFAFNGISFPKNAVVHVTWEEERE